MYKNVSFLIIFNFLFSQLFFSESAEGSSNNKYLEIYNASDQTIDLTGYAFPNATNGANTENTPVFKWKQSPGTKVIWKYSALEH